MKPITPEQLVQAIQDREKKLPWRERPTRRETLEALLECHARAVAERDAQRGGGEAVNLNDYVYVTLTEAGRWHIAHRDDYYSPAEKAGQWQLWRLMHVFGEACYMGNDAMFEKNEVSFTPPTPSSEPPTQPPRG